MVLTVVSPRGVLTGGSAAVLRDPSLQEGISQDWISALFPKWVYLLAHDTDCNANEPHGDVTLLRRFSHASHPSAVSRKIGVKIGSMYLLVQP